MTLASFREAPWKTPHPSYEGSWVHMRPAPEFATAEVVLASTYRATGFPRHPESAVPSAGREFDKASGRQRRRAQSALAPDAWKTVLHGALQSPKQPKQSSKRFLQLCPIVPDAALYSNSARLAGNSWNPGQLIERMVLMGVATEGEAAIVWKALFDGLSVGAEDDVWARWLQGEFDKRRTARAEWEHAPLNGEPVFDATELRSFRVPARQFVADLQAVIAAKACMTRRQWISILEAVLRIGAAAHVLWLCDVNARLSRAIVRVLDGDPAPARDELGRTVVEARQRPLVYGMPALPVIQDLASRYLSARLHVNLVLWRLQDVGVPMRQLHSINDMHRLLALIAGNRDRLNGASIRSELESLSDAYARDLACRRGIGSNIVEFCKYGLGQRQTADAILREYDQGYGLRKKAEYRSAPWVVALGPVALLAFAHCCLTEAAGPRSVGRLSEHLSAYGIDIARDDIADQELGRELRTLGLVLDSPDAESGMLLVPPFDMRAPSKGVQS